jgi:hypothetical protein
MLEGFFFLDIDYRVAPLLGEGHRTHSLDKILHVYLLTLSLCFTIVANRCRQRAHIQRGEFLIESRRRDGGSPS